MLQKVTIAHSRQHVGGSDGNSSAAGPDWHRLSCKDYLHAHVGMTANVLHVTMQSCQSATTSQQCVNMCETPRSKRSLHPIPFPLHLYINPLEQCSSGFGCESASRHVACTMCDKR